MLTGRRIILAVSAGVALYRSAELVRTLVRRGAEVRVLMTPNATKLISPLLFASLSGHPAHWEGFRRGDEAGAMPHLALREWGEVFVACPATANLIGKFAHGLADDLVSTAYLAASRIPVVIAPAMNPAMWEHPAVQANIATLRQRGHRILGPAPGGTACGDEGVGRLAPLDLIEDVIAAVLHCGRPDLGGLRFVITAGPTAEPLDAVRVLTNRSSGKMGYALARAAVARGAEVVLVTGPVALPAPFGVTVVRVGTAREMQAAVRRALTPECLFIGAAAVADWRPDMTGTGKTAKAAMSPSLRLEANPDIIAGVAAKKQARITVGFAAEAGDPVPNARAKLQAKQLDGIVANDITAADVGIGSDDNRVTWITPDSSEPSVRQPKTELAHWLLDRIARLAPK